jgi:hypothetical protein
MALGRGVDQEFTVDLAFTVATSRSKLRLHRSKIVVAVIIVQLSG